MQNRYQIISFYEFKNMEAESFLDEKKNALTAVMREFSISGTIILATEGFNAAVSGEPQNILQFVQAAGIILSTNFVYKSTFHAYAPFRKIDVKIKPEIVTLKKKVDIAKGRGTHVKPRDWNTIVSDPDVYLLDVRNDYEFQNGTFRSAVNPKTEKFSDLPAFVTANLDPKKHKKVAMFCTGGIRCEKFAPYLKGLGFSQVFQLDGGILKYLEEIPKKEQLWEGECFVFDERRTVDEKLEKGTGPDYSQNKKSGKL